MAENVLYIVKDGVEYALPKMTSWKLKYPKLWSSDSGRSMTGENKGTLVGIFLRIEIQVGVMTAAEAKIFLSYFNAATITVKYWDVERQAYTTASFYANDAEIELLRQRTMTYKPTSIHLIANSRRT